MARHVMKLPDVGEGVVEAELLEWKVRVGEQVSEDQHLADIMTDKATVELTAPVSGVVVEIRGAPGDRVRVGSPLITFETDPATAASHPAPLDDDRAQGALPQEDAPKTAVGSGPAGDNRAQGALPREEAPKTAVVSGPAGDDRAQGALPREQAPRATVGAGLARDPAAHVAAPQTQTAPRHARRPLAAPTVRRRAREAQVELAEVPGTGRDGRVTHEDLNRFIANGGAGAESAQAPTPGSGLPPASASAASAGSPRPPPPRPAPPPAGGTEQIRLIGLRRVIAENMARSKRSIPHYTYVEEIDVTELERLRLHLNAQHAGQRPKLTYLPFLMLVLVRALREYPQCNAHYDEASTTVTRFADVHCGIATQTPGGLLVPVVRSCGSRDLWDCAAEMQRVTQAAREGKAARDELSGSTITITSLGALGGIVSTPVINYPEVAIIGVNRSVERPVVLDGQIVVRRMMNLSCSFDHRIVDGHDAAQFVQRLRGMLEYPPTLFV